MSNVGDRPLPYGWIKQVDPATNHPFWVDTKATPPRSIWTSPFEDPQYLSEHPEAREKMHPPANPSKGEDPAPAYTKDPTDTKYDNDNSWAGDFKNPNPDRKSMGMERENGQGGTQYGQTQGGGGVPMHSTTAELVDPFDPKGKKKQKGGFFSKFKHKSEEDLKKIGPQRVQVNALHNTSTSSSSSYSNTYTNIPPAGGYPGAGYGPTQPHQGYAPQQYPQNQKQNGPSQQQQPYYPQAGPSSPYPPQGYPQQQGYFSPPQGQPYGYGPQGYYPQQPVFQGPYGPPQGQYSPYGQPPPVIIQKKSSSNTGLAIGGGLLGGLLLGDLLY